MQERKLTTARLKKLPIGSVTTVTIGRQSYDAIQSIVKHTNNYYGISEGWKLKTRRDIKKTKISIMKEETK